MNDGVLRALDRIVGMLRVNIGPDDTIQNISGGSRGEGSAQSRTIDDMKEEIINAFGTKFPNLIDRIERIDRMLDYGRQIHVIKNTMKKISDVMESQHADMTSIIIDEIKNMCTEIEKIIKLAQHIGQFEAIEVHIRKLIQGTSEIYTSLTGIPCIPRSEMYTASFPPREIILIPDIVKFMEKLVADIDESENYVETMTTMSTHDEIFKAKALDFRALYTKHNKGVNKSIESSQLYTDAFESVIKIKATRYNPIAVNAFITSLLRQWIDYVLLNEFIENDIDKKIEIQMDAFLRDVMKEKIQGNHYITRLAQMREKLSPKYISLKEKINPTRITIEQFETMFVNKMNSEPDFCDYLMRGSMELEAIDP